MNTQAHRQLGSLAKSLALANRQRWIHWLFVIGVLTLCVTVPAYPQVPSSESVILQALYTGTAGDSWTTNTNWKVDGAFNVDNECTWYGITCDAGVMHVIGIELELNNLNGSIPDLTVLTNLKVFHVDNNYLSGSIPSLSGVTNLQDFRVYNNILTGSIPDLTGLTGLQIFHAANNQLSGPIPDLTGLTSLQIFHAANNQLSGSIPCLSTAAPCSSGLTSLNEIEVNTNQLTGPIPNLTGLTNLLYFNANNNHLTGAIPSLTGLTTLQYFQVGNNHLNGTLPNPPSPSSLVAGESSLCDNDFPTSSYVDSTAWDTATAMTPWYTNCNGIFYDGFEG